VAGLRGARTTRHGEALAVLELATIAATLVAADAALKARA